MNDKYQKLIDDTCALINKKSEIIKSIEEIDGYKPNSENYRSYEGYKIITDKQEIFVLISDRSSCCESWGHFANHDDVDYFIGAELKTVGIVDNCLSTKEYHLDSLKNLDCGEAIFVNLETSKGTLQLTVYNSHNGFYSHEIIIRANQLPKKGLSCSI
jgi:hypothetical protein